MNCNAMFHFNLIISKILSFQQAVNKVSITIINEVVHIPFFHPECSKIWRANCAHPARVRFMKPTIEKVDSHTQVVLSIIKE